MSTRAPAPVPGGAAAAPPALSALGIERRFGRFTARRGIDLEVRQGSTLALFGPNGAGKTTLLRVLAQVLRPSRGTVRVFGRDPGKEPAAVLASLGFVSHEIALYLDLTPEENLVFTGRLHGLDRVRERAREALERVGVGGRTDPVRALSRGFQQRVALARALVHGPRLLLLDEPWTGLDPDAQRVLRERLDAHRTAGGTTVLTTHDLRQGHERSDRVAFIARGRLAYEAAAADVSLGELERAYAEAAGKGP